jgi:hypothetical protein
VIEHQAAQLYGPHMDTHATTTDATSGGQRLLTVLLYLNAVEEGGETEFVSLGQLRVRAPRWVIRFRGPRCLRGEVLLFLYVESL